MTTSLKPLSDNLPEGRKNLAAALRTALEESGKSLRQVAFEVGISPAALSQILSGRHKPKEENLNRIIRAITSREMRKADPRHSYITERWRRLLLYATMCIGLLAAAAGVYMHFELARQAARDDKCTLPLCGTPPATQIPDPSPGPWPEGLPATPGYVSYASGSSDHSSPGLYLSARGSATRLGVEYMATVSIGCAVKSDPSGAVRYLVRLEGGLTPATRRLAGHWFWADKANVVKLGTVPACDRQRQIAVDMGMTPEWVAYLAGLSRVD